MTKCVCFALSAAIAVVLASAASARDYRGNSQVNATIHYDAAEYSRWLDKARGLD